MNSNRTAPPTTTGPPADHPADPTLATCPMCHTQHPSLTRVAVAAGEEWRCSRCAQVWNEQRLSAVAAYARWVQDREQVSTAEPRLRIVSRAGTTERL
jgi:hypothetical protein